MSIMFNEICINEEMLPIYIYIYIYIIMNNNQNGSIYSLNKLVDNFMYLGSNIKFTENDISKRIENA